MPVPTIPTPLLFLVTAIFEIAGCFAFWAWLRMDKSALWVIPGTLSLVVFAYLLTKADTVYAGRAYAAYGGIYIIASMAWMWLVESARPDRWDGFGATLCLIGALVIIFGPRG